MRLFRRKKVKVGLALGGGGTRGFAHVGALKAFEENNITFDAVAGTSAGSLVGAFYAAGYSYKEIYDIAKEIKEKDIRASKIFFMPSKTDGIEKLIIDNLGDINIEDLKKEFYAIAVDMKTAQELHINKGNLAKAVAGSCSVPGVFHPVIFENKVLSDGGLSNTLPSNVLKLYNCDYVVAIDINPDRVYGTNSTKLTDILFCSIRILMKSNVLKGYLYSDVLLKPDTKRFKATKKDGFEEMIEEGYKAAMEYMEHIKDLFKKKKVSKRRYKKFVSDNSKF